MKSAACQVGRSNCIIHDVDSLLKSLTYSANRSLYIYIYIYIYIYTICEFHNGSETFTVIVRVQFLALCVSNMLSLHH
jgi:hypothetical protein